MEAGRHAALQPDERLAGAEFQWFVNGLLRVVRSLTGQAFFSASLLRVMEDESCDDIHGFRESPRSWDKSFTDAKGPKPGKERTAIFQEPHVLSRGTLLSMALSA